VAGSERAASAVPAEHEPTTQSIAVPGDDQSIEDVSDDRAATSRQPVGEPAAEEAATESAAPVPATLPASSSLQTERLEQVAGALPAAGPKSARTDDRTLVADSTTQPAADSSITHLPWAHRPRHTPAMMAVLRRADKRVRQGFQRGARGAHFSARADFVAALAMIAEANDAAQQTRHYSSALDLGLVALKESATFAGRGTDQSASGVARIVGGHQTTILKGAQGVELTAIGAAHRYCAYAGEQLAAAAAGEATGSMALFGLAKVSLAVGGGGPGRSLERSLQATALYKAALLADGNNFCAANELGVLLAENGNLEQARDLFLRSVSIAPHAATWHNLAIVHSRLGETQLAEQAQAQADALPKPRAPRGGPEVQWVDAQTFARVTSASDATLPALPAVAEAPVSRPPTDKPPVNVAKKPKTDWLPWNSRR
jgi:tetratricopeptide (TPR) repeat protein